MSRHRTVAGDHEPPGGGRGGSRIGRKVLLGLTAGVLVVVGLLASVAFLLPRFIDRGPIRARILSEASRRIPGQIKARSLELHWRPLPRLILRHPRYDLPGEVSALAESVTLVPDLDALLHLKLRLSEVRVRAPTANVRLPPSAAPRLPPLSLEAAEEGVSRGARFLATRLPGRVSVRDGTLDISRGKSGRVHLDRVSGIAAFAPERLRLRLAGASGFARRIELRCDLDVEAWRGSAALSLRGLQPEKLPESLLPGEPPAKLSGELTAQISLQAEGPRTLHFDLRGNAPSLWIAFVGNRTALSGLELEGTASIAGRKIELSLARGSLEQPRLSARGSFRWDPEAGRTTLALSGEDVDLTALRPLLLSLPLQERGLRKTLEVVRGGLAPRFEVQASASDPAGLRQPDSWSAKASVRQARLWLPALRLPVDQVSGEVEISRSVLTATGISGRTGASTGRAGRLRMGLRGPSPPFHLETRVSADLAQLLRRLRQWVHGGAFRRELDRVEAASGRASGRLVVKGRIHALHTEVDAETFHLSGRYGRIPFPLDLRGGRLTYRPGRVSVSGLRGRVGSSGVSGLNARVSWHGSPALRVTASGGRLALGELFPWVASLPPARDALRGIGPVAGSLTLSSAALSGPALSPLRWTFQIRGDLDGFSVAGSRLPAPLSVSGGEIAAQEGSVTWEHCQASMLDGSVLTSGRASDLRSGHPSVETDADGEIGPNAAAWLARAGSLPPYLRVKRAFRLRSGHLSANGSETVLSGSVDLENGPVLTVDVRRTPEGLFAPRLSVRDDRSDARLSFAMRKRDWDLAFQGRLARRTVEELLAGEPLFPGRVEGDLRAHVLFEHPGRSTVQGSLRVEGLELKAGAVPIRVEEAALKGAGHRVEIDGARLLVAGQPLRVEGAVDSTASEFRSRLSVSSEFVDAKALLGALKEGGAQEGSSFLRALRSLPLQATATFDLGAVRYGPLTWSPVKAEATLGRHTLTVRVSEAGLCGIDTPGRVDVTRAGTTVEVRPATRAGRLNPTLSCLWGKEGLAKGAFQLQGRAVGHGQPGQLLRSSQGSFRFSSRNGRIFRYTLLAKVFAVLNVPGILLGRLPDLAKDGFGYDSASATGMIRDGKLVFHDAVIDGTSTKVFWDGDIDLVRRRVDLTVVVAPLKTIDLILRHIPIVNRILGRALISFPVRVTGNLADPDVIPLAPAAVGAGVLDLMKRVLLLPFKLVQPLLPTPEKR